jgi:hypothetical protein
VIPVVKWAHLFFCALKVYAALETKAVTIGNALAHPLHAHKVTRRIWGNVFIGLDLSL